MDIIIRIFQGILLIGTGWAIINYRREIDNWFGGFDFAEKWFGAGGTLFFLTLVGSISVIIGFIVWAGGFDVLGNGIATLFGG
ncbi:MAG: hypothetical protein Fur0024_0770 [Patescibacteria group bacterium]